MGARNTLGSCGLSHVLAVLGTASWTEAPLSISFDSAALCAAGCCDFVCLTRLIADSSDYFTEGLAHGLSLLLLRAWHVNLLQNSRAGRRDSRNDRDMAMLAQKTNSAFLSRVTGDPPQTHVLEQVWLPSETER